MTAARPDPVVGRAPERAVLAAALGAAVAGAGAVVVVTGPAGIGKTRLVELLAQDAGSAGVVVRWDAASTTAPRRRGRGATQAQVMSFRGATGVRLPVTVGQSLYP